MFSDYRVEIVSFCLFDCGLILNEKQGSDGAASGLQWCVDI